MENDIPLFPIAGWTIGPIKAYEAVTFKLDYLAGPMQQLHEASQSPQFVLTAAQAEELATALTGAIQKLRSAEFQAAPGPRH